MGRPGDNGESIVTFDNTTRLAELKVDLCADDIGDIPQEPRGRIRALYNGDILCCNPQFLHFDPELHPGVPPPTAFLHYWGLYVDRHTGRVEKLCAIDDDFYAWYDEADIRQEDVLVDLGGNCVTPGLIDAHAHLAAWGLILGDYAFGASGRPCENNEFRQYHSIPDVVENVNFWLAGNLPPATDEYIPRDWDYTAANRPTHPWVFLHGYQNSDTLARCLTATEAASGPVGLDAVTEAGNGVSREVMRLVERLDSANGPYSDVHDDLKLSAILHGLHLPTPPTMMIHGSGQIGWVNSVALAMAYANEEFGHVLWNPTSEFAIPYAVTVTPENRDIGPPAQVQGRAIYVRVSIEDTEWWVFSGAVRHYDVLGLFEKMMPENPLLPTQAGHEGAVKGLYKAVERFHSYGITAAHDCILPRRKPEWKSFEAYEACAYPHDMHYIQEGLDRLYRARRTLRMHVRLHYYCENLEAIDDIYASYLDQTQSHHDRIRLGMHGSVSPHSWMKFLGWKFALDGGMLAGSAFSQSPYADPTEMETTRLQPDRFREVPAVESEEQQDTTDHGRSFGLLLRGGENGANAFIRPESAAAAELVMGWLREHPEVAQRGFFNLDRATLDSVDPQMHPTVRDFILDIRQSMVNARDALITMIERCRGFRSQEREEGHDPHLHQIALHSVSDGAVAVYCNALRDYWAGHPEDGPEGDPRFRIEHALWTPMDVIWKFLKDCNTPDHCGALISTQPGVLLQGASPWHRMFRFDILPVPCGMPIDSYGQPVGQVVPVDKAGRALHWTAAHEASAHLSGRYGSNRTYYTLPLREFISAHIPVAFGSDPPANARPDPRDNFVGSVLRAGLVETGNRVGYKHYDLDLAVRPGTGVQADDCQWIDVGQALACHTYWAAFAARDEGDMGWFSDQGEGTFADLVVWAGNPLAVDLELEARKTDPLIMEDPDFRNRVAMGILEALTPLLTVVEGEVVHLAD